LLQHYRQNIFRHEVHQMSCRDKAQAISTEMDALLLPFLNATTREEEELLLTRLLDEHVNPIIRQTLRYKMQWHFNAREGSYRNQDLDEVYREIQLHLLKRLRQFKSQPLDEPIANLRSYIATTTRNACDEYFRRRFPQRRNLKDKIRYYLTSRAGLSLWAEAGKGWMSGLAEWEREQRSASGAVGDTHSVSDLLDTLSGRLTGIAIQSLELDELLEAVLRAIGHPLTLDHLTAVVAKLLGVEDPAMAQFDVGANSLSEHMVSPEAGPDVLIEQRQLLGQLWQEIQRLPRAQRVALLCNMKSPQGINVITLFPATQVATFEQIAAVLEIPPAEFDTLLSRLPLDDLSLAEYLGTTRQQVIYLRRNARDRLLRRRRALEGDRPL
jgi:DNA-directed RNA polymerase specialized sigma24 family protein